MAKRWTIEEKNFVINNWQKMQDWEMANALDRTVEGVKEVRKSFKLARPRGWVTTPEQETNPITPEIRHLAFHARWV